MKTKDITLTGLMAGLIFQTVSGVVIFAALYVCVSKAGIKKVFAN